MDVSHNISLFYPSSCVLYVLHMCSRSHKNVFSLFFLRYLVKFLKLNTVGARSSWQRATQKLIVPPLYPCWELKSFVSLPSPPPIYVIIRRDWTIYMIRDCNSLDEEKSLGWSSLAFPIALLSMNNEKWDFFLKIKICKEWFDIKWLKK